MHFSTALPPQNALACPKNRTLSTHPLFRWGLIYVEGNDERNLFEQLIQEEQVEDDFEVRVYRGEDRLNADLPALVDTDGFDQLEGLIITQDADEDPQATSDSIRNVLDECRLPVPEEPFDIEEGHPSIAYFVFPDGEREGSLETLCIESVVDDKEDVFSCVDQFLSCLQDTENGLPGDQLKARAHSYIVSTSTPHSSVGYAAKQGYWNLNHDVFECVRDIIQRI